MIYLYIIKVIKKSLNWLEPELHNINQTPKWAEDYETSEKNP